MKHNVVAYMAKENVSAEDFVDISSGPKLIKIDESYLKANLYLKKSKGQPKWSTLFSGIGIDQGFFSQETVRGVLITKENDRLFAFTFGHGRSLINQNHIQRGFGLRVSMNIGDSKKLKSIDKSTLDKVSLNTRSQASINTGVEDFDFEFDHEILKSITAIVDRDDNELEVVSGCDSVSLYTEIDISNIRLIAKRLYQAFISDSYKKKFPWADYIEPETDPLVRNDLDNLVVLKINEQEQDDFWISPPEIIDFENFSGFVYKKKDVPCFHHELNIGILFEETKTKFPISLSNIKNKKIYIYSAGEEEIGKWSMYRCLNGEVVYKGGLYVINDGTWYKVKDSFYNTVEEYFEKIKNCNIEFLEYGGLREGDYLEMFSDGENVALLDRKFVQPKGVSNGLEFCDLLSQCGAIIHVKKYGSSAVLNHLFSQASLSVDMLMNSPEIIGQVNKHLEDTYLTLNFKKEEVPRKYRVVLAVMQKKDGPLHFPFFAKVSLRHHCRRIENMGFKVEKAKINYGDKVLRK